ncbi:allophanate hydrolase subunit 2 [Krasilnikovia cinnamomea]|uniref:Allophanate hydrolase subunit 2 n=1 Tax=Krasilnikovia cinnamomea TaxID=349313 RepID=A0A4Q7ZNY4_9ACTN|nr:biotin-dependent carboxyltransferase family protein [Krasilnikovia cinnamomea]RZU52414.1 allophanate hydrolase subunit 2 [Krasilnikovia cinnamomea]
MSVLRPGPLTVLKDLGRPGRAALGVAPSGAADRRAFARANRLVGNEPGAAALEIVLGGLRVRFDGPAVVALTGTDAALTVDGQPAGAESAVRVAAGAEVGVTAPRRGLRSYLAVRGGFAVAPVLGSRSTDLLAGLGPPRLAAGDVLPVGDAPAGAAADDIAAAGPARAGGAAPERSSPGADSPGEAARGQALPGAASSGEAVRGAGDDGGEPVVLRVDLGPRDDWFTAEAVATFLDAGYTVNPASDAVGLRLSGPALARRDTRELPSEGVVRGSVQVPPDGMPIVFQADHPLTGGYPVIAVLTPASADRAAQLRPGRRVVFRPAGVDGTRRHGGRCEVPK